MRILALSDIHGKRSVIEASSKLAKMKHVDIIVLTGDITHRGNINEIKEIVTRLNLLSNIPVYFVLGNMDPISTDDALSEEGVFYVQNRTLKVGNFNIIGLSGSPPTPFGTVNERSEAELREDLESNLEIPENTILLTHSPPFYTELDKTRTGLHAGSKAVLDFINKHQPLLVVCGHIHEAQGKIAIEKTIVINPGAATHGNASIIVIYENGLIKADFLKL